MLDDDDESCLPSLKSAIIDRQRHEINLQSSHELIKQLHDHFILVDGYQGGPRNFYSHFKKQYSELCSMSIAMFNPSGYQIDDDYETETVINEEGNALGYSFFENTDNFALIDFSDKLSENNPEQAKEFWPVNENSEVDLQKNGLGEFSTEEPIAEADQNTISNLNGHFVPYGNKCIKRVVRTLFSLCGFPAGFLVTDDLEFDLKVLAYGLWDAEKDKFQIIRERYREIAFLRNLIRDARRDWNLCTLENKRLQEHLQRDMSQISSLKAEIEKLQEKVLEQSANSKIVESRQKRMREIVADNLQLHQKVAILESSADFRANPGRRARFYNYKLTKQEERNEILVKDLRAAEKELDNRTALLIKYETAKAKVKEMQARTLEREKLILYLEQKFNQKEETSLSLESLRMDVAELTKKNRTLVLENERLRLQENGIRAAQYQDKKTNELFKQCVDKIQNKYLESLEIQRFYKKECDRLASLDQDYRQRIVEEHNENQRKLFEHESNKKQLESQLKSMIDRVKFYKDKSDQLQNNLNQEILKKSKHERFKEAFLSSSLFVRSKSAGVNAVERSYTPRAFASREISTACSLPAPRKNHVLPESIKI